MFPLWSPCSPLYYEYVFNIRLLHCWSSTVHQQPKTRCALIVSPNSASPLGSNKLIPWRQNTPHKPTTSTWPTTDRNMMWLENPNPELCLDQDLIVSALPWNSIGAWLLPFTTPMCCLVPLPLISQTCVLTPIITLSPPLSCSLFHCQVWCEYHSCIA